jgi:hypothetical protein
VKPIAGRLAALTEGLTVEKIALIIALGFVLGTFPVLGCATALCAAAALAFRLNLPALQVMNQIATPAQYLLLLPFARLGARLIGSRAGLAGAVLHAITGWFCISAPLGVLLYFTLVYLMRGRLRPRVNAIESIA